MANIDTGARHGRSCVSRPRYRFTGAHTTVDGRRILTWEKAIPGDSRVEEITVSAQWFYAQMVKPKPRYVSVTTPWWAE